MSEKSMVILKRIVPKIMYYQNKIYDIISVDPSLIIKNYQINLNNFKVKSLMLYNSHPNCNPNNNIFCLPPNIINKNIEEVKDIISYLLSIYNINSCYFSPWGLIKYKEQ